MAELHPFNHAGNFTIGTPGLAGGLLLKALLTVPQNSSKVAGLGVLNQATNPPLHNESSFHGSVHTLGVGAAKQVYALQGSAVPPLLGAPHVVELLIQLDDVWGKTGKASYTYVQGDTRHRVENQDVSVQWLLQNNERAA